MKSVCALIRVFHTKDDPGKRIRGRRLQQGKLCRVGVRSDERVWVGALRRVKKSVLVL